MVVWGLPHHLAIHFHDGLVEEFHGVSRALAEALAEAEDQEAYVQAHIAGRFPSTVWEAFSWRGGRAAPVQATDGEPAREGGAGNAAS